MEKMKAVVYTEYGAPDVLKVKEVEKPTPKDKEVLIRIHAVSVNYGDIVARNFKNISTRDFNMPSLFWLIAKFSFGLKKPKVKILGNTFAGEVVLVGKEVTKILQMLWTFVTGGKRVVCALANPSQEDLYMIKDLVDNGKFKSIIDKEFPMEQTAEAHRFVESGKRKGSVVVIMKK